MHRSSPEIEKIWVEAIERSSSSSSKVSSPTRQQPPSSLLPLQQQYQSPPKIYQSPRKILHNETRASSTKLQSADLNQIDTDTIEIDRPSPVKTEDTCSSSKDIETIQRVNAQDSNLENNNGTQTTFRTSTNPFLRRLKSVEESISNYNYLSNKNKKSEKRSTLKKGTSSSEASLTPPLSPTASSGSSSLTVGGLTTLCKTKINEFYDRLNVNKRKYNIIKSKRMEVKNILEKSNVMEREVVVDEPKPVEEKPQQAVEIHEESNRSTDVVDNIESNLIQEISSIPSYCIDNIVEKTEQTPIAPIVKVPPLSTPLTPLSSSPPCALTSPIVITEDAIIEKAAAKLSPLTTISPILPNNLNRKMKIKDIGRSTSESLRLRSKYSLGNIGRSLSEHQDDDVFASSNEHATASLNNSHPSSSNCSMRMLRSNNGVERRAFSVSPVQRGFKRGISGDGPQQDITSKQKNQLLRDGSLQSDSSHCSSVESLLESRKPDPEMVLRNLGFGFEQNEDVLARIPERFLKPSQVRGIDTEAFLRKQQLANDLHEHSVLGYRGLVGNPHLPPSNIVAKIMERFQLNDEKRLHSADDPNLHYYENEDDDDDDDDEDEGVDDHFANRYNISPRPPPPTPCTPSIMFKTAPNLFKN